jgi:hypothetical protein
MKSGAELIAEERERQVKQECWTAEHDDKHVEGQLAGAGLCYALWHCGYIGKFAWRLAMALWPWDEEWWKPKDAVKDLTRAGALIAAEIDRIQRAEQPRIITRGE